MTREGAVRQMTGWLGALRGPSCLALAGLGTALLLGAASLWAMQRGTVAAGEAAQAALEAAAAGAESRLTEEFARLDAALARQAAGDAPGPSSPLARRLARADRPVPEEPGTLMVPTALLEAALAGGSPALLGPFPDPATGEPVLMRALALGGDAEGRIALAEVPVAALGALLAPLARPVPIELRLETSSGLPVLAVPAALGSDTPEASLRRPVEAAGLIVVAAWPAASQRGWPLAGWAAAGAAGLAAALLLGLGYLVRLRNPATPPADEATARRLAAAVEALPEAFVLWDADDRLVTCNGRFRALFPLNPGAAFRPGMSRAAAAAALQPAARLGDGASPFALRAEPADAPPQELNRADGGWLLAAERQLPGGGRVGLYRDASALRRANAALAEARDAAQAATAARSRLLSHLSHELRAPLTSLLQLADQLGREASLAEGPRRQAVMVGAAARHLLALANEVLDFGALEAASLTLKPEEVALPALLEDAVAIASPMAETRRVRLAVRMDDLPPRAVLDAGRLRQVLLNLLTNAVKFTPEGSEVRLEASRVEDRLRLVVTDQGPGVPSSERDRLFRDFSRLRPEAGEGTGLGLAISARLVALMGGEIRYDAAADSGARFRVELPFVPPTAPQRRPEPAAAPTLVGGRLRLLAVDDSPANLSVLRALLSTTGFQLETRTNALAGLEALAAAADAGHPHDVVLMDVMMPGMDGLEATRRIRALPGVIGRVPVIAVTASAFPEDVAACTAAGMSGHVPKPVERMALLRALAQAVGGGAQAHGATAEDELAALRPAFLAELAARLAELETGGAAVVEALHAICGTVGHLGEAELVTEARAALRALREQAPEASARVDALALHIGERFPGLRASPVAAA
ncbi:MAG: ATP-binding protein [Rubritepida sp.]|nr:ATP-binding protein [Rubritepida sp.]